MMRTTTQKRRRPVWSDAEREAWLPDAAATSAADLLNVVRQVWRPEVGAGIKPDAVDAARRARAALDVFLALADGAAGKSRYAIEDAGTVLHWGGETIVQRTVLQRAIVHALFIAEGHGAPSMPTSELKIFCDSDDDTFTMARAFRGHRTWRRVIVPGDRHGTWRLRPRKLPRLAG